MSFDSGDFDSDVDEGAEGVDARGCDAFGADALAEGHDVSSGSEGSGFGAEPELADAGHVQGLDIRPIEAGRMEGMQPANQILAVFPSDAEALNTTEATLVEVEAYTQAHGYGPGPEIEAVDVIAWDSRAELASYSGRSIELGNYTENVNIASAAHEGMHASSFLSEYSEVDPVTGNVTHHDICGIDEVVTVRDAEGSKVAEYRNNEQLNEGMTVNYTREMLAESDHSAAAETEECLSYDIAADFAGELRGAFPELVDGAYFNGQLEPLRDAVDEAAGVPGTFDEISMLLDRVGDENLSLEARVECYDRAYELLKSTLR